MSDLFTEGRVTSIFSFFVPILHGYMGSSISPSLGIFCQSCAYFNQGSCKLRGVPVDSHDTCYAWKRNLGFLDVQA